LKEALARVIEATKGTPRFIELAREFEMKDQNPALLEAAIRSSDDNASSDALRLLIENEGTSLLRSALDGPEARRVAEVLGFTSDNRVVPLLEPFVMDAQGDLELRKQAVRSLARVQEGAARLLEFARQNRIPDELQFTATAELNNVPWPGLRAEAGRLLPPPQTQGAQALPPLADLMKMKGNAAHGAEVFRAQTVGCALCHQVKGEGVDFGPNLSEIGGKLGRDSLFESILAPSSGISFGFEAWNIELKDGNEWYGIIASETSDEIAVKVQTGIVTRHKKSDIVKREQQKLSIMPLGMQQAMSVQDLVDLVEYLASLK